MAEQSRQDGKLDSNEAAKEQGFGLRSRHIREVCKLLFWKEGNAFR